jgi:F0F1-type ATP synthase membrane subunit b/b'
MEDAYQVWFGENDWLGIRRVADGQSVYYRGTDNPRQACDELNRVAAERDAAREALKLAEHERDKAIASLDELQQRAGDANDAAREECDKLREALRDAAVSLSVCMALATNHIGRTANAAMRAALLAASGEEETP